MAVSGGVDSVVLLHLLQTLPETLKPRLIVAHFDHRLRKASGADARFVKAWCLREKIPFRLGVAPRWKDPSNVESRSRDLRYRFLETAAARSKAKRIATAHHADDQLETFAMRWLQGAGLKGLSGIRPLRELERGRLLIRPLLGVTRREILDYARAFGLEYREDETNRSDRYLRNRLRKLLARLQKENPNLAERTSVNSLFLQADDEELDKQVRSIFRRLAMKTSRKVALPLFKYRLMSESLRYRLLQKAAQSLQPEGYALPAAAVLKADEILCDRSSDDRTVSLDLPSGLRLEKEGKSIVFSRRFQENRIASRKMP